MKPPIQRRRYQKGQLLDDKDRWMCRFWQDVIEAGKLSRKRRYEFLAWKKEVPTRRQAQKLLDDLLRAEGINDTQTRPRTFGTFKEFAESWITKVLVHDKPSTQRTRKSVIQAHLVPEFGSFYFRDLTSEVFQEWVTANRESASIHSRKAILKVMWQTAKDWGYTTTDPLDRLKMPPKRKNTTYNFSVEEALAIIEEAKGWHKLFFRILAATGMRPGELAGLRVCDIEKCRLKITQSVWNQNVQTPKSENAYRAFVISPRLSDALQDYIRETGRKDLVFLNSHGKPLHIGYIQSEVLSPILEKLGIRAKVEAMGIRKLGQYAFRHMNITELERQGVPLKTIQKRVGHAEGSDVTAGHYLHAVDADDLRAAELMSVFDPIASTKQ